MNIVRTINIISVLLVAMATTVAAETSISEKRKQMAQRLDSLENAQPGVSFSGEIKGGFESSDLQSSVQFEGPASQVSAASQADLRITARPTSDTRIHADLRMHQDWQKGYQEGPNPVLFNWLSFEGQIYEKTKFELGDFRAYGTPLTIHSQEVSLMQEPEVFTQKRKEAMAVRKLQGEERLLQGLQADYNSLQMGFIDNIQVKGNLTRLRNLPKSENKLFWDFDEVDRYNYGARVAVTIMRGLQMGVNYQTMFDRVKSSRNFLGTGTDADQGAAIDNYALKEYEYNTVLSVDVGANTGKVIRNNNIIFTVDAEYAMSQYRMDLDTFANNLNTPFQYTVIDTATGDTSVQYYELVEHHNRVDTVLKSSPEKTWQKAVGDELSANALWADVTLGYRMPKAFSVAFVVTYLDVGKNFTSELAQSASYVGGGILNVESGLSMHSTFESMYKNIYRTQPLTRQNSMVNDNWGRVESSYESYLYNNYIRKQYLRNAYTNGTMTPYERSLMEGATNFYDRRVDIALPYGKATPNRKGLDVAFNSTALDNAIEVQGRYAALEEKESGEIQTLFLNNYGQVILDAPMVQYTEMEAGLAVHVHSILGWEHPVVINGAWGESKKSHDVYAPFAADPAREYKVTRNSIGLKLGYKDRIALLSGYQTLKGVADYALYQNNEEIFATALQIKIAAGSYLTLEKGFLKSDMQIATVDEAGAVVPFTYDYKRDLTSASISVMF
jgi:hypothetical protein